MCGCPKEGLYEEGFTKEESQEIMEECQPVNDRVMQATEEEAKKLVKRMPRKTFIADESEADDAESDPESIPF